MDEKISTDEQENSLKGLHIKTLSTWMVLCTIIVSILIGTGIINVMNHYHDLSHMTNEYIVSQKDVLNMSLGSNYLTEQARLYAITKDSAYIEAYFTEADITKRRDNAVQEMAAHLQGNDPTTVQLLSEALDLSNELMDLEIHSMKLIALSMNTDISTFPSNLQNYQLPEKELQYTSEEKAETAYQLVFGPEYRNAKQAIEEKLSSVTENVISACSLKQADSEKGMTHALFMQCLYTILIVILIIFDYIMIAVLILKPIRIYIKCIENNNFLQIMGAYEFKYLAITYNKVYKMAVTQQELLRQKAENDALTGLLNRQAFEQLKVKLHDTLQPIALLLVDVDIFKSINDNYGHEVGDQALIRTANLLKENFRSVDYVLRIGGDEFAVIMANIPPEKKDIISEKVSNINYELQHPQQDFPKYSISVGVAFSANGYHDELFHYADQALYQTKENGRCGCSFYTS